MSKEIKELGTELKVLYAKNIPKGIYDILVELNPDMEDNDEGTGMYSVETIFNSSETSFEEDNENFIYIENILNLNYDYIIA